MTERQKNKKKLSTGDKIAILAFIVSIFSIIFSIYQFKSQRDDSERQFFEVRYNDSIQRDIAQKNLKNSVTPLLVIEKFAATGETSMCGIQLKNEGIGPAVIDSWEVKFDDQIDSLGNIENFARRNQMYCWNGDWANIRFRKGMAIRPGGDEWLFSVPSKEIKTEDEGIFDRLITKHITVSIQYHSLTNDSFRVLH